MASAAKLSPRVDAARRNGLIAADAPCISLWYKTNVAIASTLAFEREHGLVNVVVDGPQVGNSVPAVLGLNGRFLLGLRPTPGCELRFQPRQVLGGDLAAFLDAQHVADDDGLLGCG